jgi:hypothetical protein
MQHQKKRLLWSLLLAAPLAFAGSYAGAADIKDRSIKGLSDNNIYRS